ncbi:hypothetical protein [Streptomyces sparsogenes]|uniref:hypothetical protein n=1 Tax=Streptomyces sparsogenes TaxID=67365 RepID=UPI000AF08449|nr:hypothetical protein [Streptomyces sparsogenes]
MTAVGRDPEPRTPEEAEARRKRVAKLHQQAAADYRTGFGRPKPASKKALAA